MLIISTRAAALAAAALCCHAEPKWFAGGGVGVSTLSGDARSVLSPATSVSLYKPENGPLAHAFAGRHWRDYLSFQAAWSWNRNRLALASTRIEGGQETTYEQARESRQQNLAADAMLYFRGRRSFVRPYLSVGLGVMAFRSHSPVLRVSRGRPVLPPDAFDSVKPGFRAAAGIELLGRSGWGFRYAFLETISANPVGARLDPRGQRGLANFQNLFGLVKYF
jgi:hypothetical protein